MADGIEGHRHANGLTSACDCRGIGSFNRAGIRRRYADISMVCCGEITRQHMGFRAALDCVRDNRTTNGQRRPGSRHAAA